MHSDSILAHSTVVPRFNRRRSFVLYRLTYQGRELVLRRQTVVRPCAALDLHLHALRLDLGSLDEYSAPHDYAPWLYFRMDALHLDAYTDPAAVSQVRAFYGLALPHFLELLRTQADFRYLLGADYATFLAGEIVVTCTDDP